MKGITGKFLNIRQGETVYVSYLLFHYFFQGFGLAILFVVANTLFLSANTVEALPQVFICSAVVIFIIGKIYDFLGDRFSLPRMIMGVSIMTALSVLIFFIAGVSLHFAWIPFGLFILYQVISTQIDSEFWGLSSLVFDVRQAKRLFGLISVGDVPAKLLGALLVHSLVHIMGGLVHVLVLSSASFIIGAVILNRLLAKIPKHHFEHHTEEKETGKTIRQGAIARFFRSDLILMLSVLYLVAAIVITFIEFSFLSEVEHKFENQRAMADFFAVIYAIGNGLIIINKLFVSGKAIDRLGVVRSLLSLPVLLLAICLSMFATGYISNNVYPLMWFFAVMVIMKDVVQAVLYDPLFLALFQPLPASLRHRAHNIINGLINPLGLGISGIILMVWILLFRHIDLYHINYVLIVMTLVWIVFILLVFRNYMAVLKSAINKRQIRSGKLETGDEATIRILKDKLGSPEPDEVIYACEILAKSNNRILEQSLDALLANPVPEVRTYILNKIYDLNLPADNEILYSIIETDLSPAVRESAIRLYCSRFEDVIDRITSMLDSTEPAIRCAAIKGFLKSGDLEPMMLGGQQLLSLFGSQDPAELIMAIEIAGDLSFRNYYRPLLDLQHHPNPEVKKAAIIASGKIKNPKLIGYLVPLLDNRLYKKVTINSLGHFGEAVLEHIDNPEFRQKHPEEAIKLCARIGGKRAVEMLFHEYFADANGEILDEVLRALSRMDFEPKQYLNILGKKLDDELSFSFICLQMIASLRHHNEDNVLTNALTSELDNATNRFFTLLSFMYQKETIVRAKIAYASANAESRANAMEYLDNAIDKELKAKLFPMLESIPLDDKIKALSHYFALNHEITQDKIPALILNQANAGFMDWTRAVVIYKFGQVNDSKTLEAYAASGNKLLSECALQAIEKQKHTSQSPKSKIKSDMKHNQHHQQETMLEIEKVLILKSTNMFAGTPENILVGIAGIAREEHKEKGEDIFRKDETGNCLYIICDGDVSIHINGKELSVLHKRDIFGELALLDPEPRSATATTLTDCLLLRIDQSAFNELIEERPEVAQGILTILSRRIRSQNELLQTLRGGK